jgi:hypothetical protein
MNRIDIGWTGAAIGATIGILAAMRLIPHGGYAQVGYVYYPAFATIGCAAGAALEWIAYLLFSRKREKVRPSKNLIFLIILLNLLGLNAPSILESSFVTRLTVLGDLSLNRIENYFRRPGEVYTLYQIPHDVFQHCYDSKHRIAEENSTWNPSDVENTWPQSRLVTACKISNDEWQLTCEEGGRAHYFKVIKMQRIHNSWHLQQAIRLSDNPRINCKSLK